MTLAGVPPTLAAIMRYLLVVAAVIVSTLGGAAFVGQRNTDCADTVAHAFVFQHTVDVEATLSGVLHRHRAVVQRRQLGVGAWHCLAPDKQRELSVAGIEDEKSLHAKIHSTGHAYDRADRLGLLPQVSEPPLHVYALNRTVRTHELTTPSFVDGFSDWLQGISQRPQLQAVERSQAVLLFIRVDTRGKVDKFGFIDSDG